MSEIIGATNNSSELKKESISDLMKKTLDDGRVDSEELLQVYNKLEEVKASETKETIEESEKFLKEHSKLLLDTGLIIDKSNFNQERFNNLILTLNKHIGINSHEVFDFSKLGDNFKLKLVNGKIEVIKPTNTELLEDSIKKLNGEYKGIKITINGGICNLKMGNHSTMFTIDKIGNEKFLSVDGLKKLVDKKLVDWNVNLEFKKQPEIDNSDKKVEDKSEISPNLESSEINYDKIFQDILETGIDAEKMEEKNTFDVDMTGLGDTSRIKVLGENKFEFSTSRYDSGKFEVSSITELKQLIDDINEHTSLKYKKTNLKKGLKSNPYLQTELDKVLIDISLLEKKLDSKIISQIQQDNKEVPEINQKENKDIPVKEEIKTEVKTENEYLKIGTIENLKTLLSDKNIVNVAGGYYFVGKDFKTNTQTELNTLKNDKGEVYSLEEILGAINGIDGIQLAFDESMSEDERLTLISKVTGIDFELNGKIIENSFSTVELNPDFKNGIYSSIDFENLLIKELNNLIPYKILRTADKTIEQAIYEKVKTLLSTYGIHDLKITDLILSSDNKVSDLVKDQNIFDKINTQATITLKDGIFAGIPSNIDSGKIYKVQKDGESVVMNGENLKKVLSSNQEYIKKALVDERNIDVDEKKLALEELGIIELKDVDFEGKNEESKYEFSFDGKTVLIEKTTKGLNIVSEIESFNGKDIKAIDLEGKIKEYVIALNAVDFKKDILSNKSVDDKKIKETTDKTKEERQKENEEKIENKLSEMRFSVKDLVGKEFKDLDPVKDLAIINWLKEFSKSDLTSNISIEDIKVDLSKEEVSFSFDDSGLFNEKFNKNLVLSIKGIHNNGEIDTVKFTKLISTAANTAISNMYK